MQIEAHLHNHMDLNSGEDPFFGQIRIQGSVPRTKGDFKNYMK